MGRFGVNVVWPCSDVRFFYVLNRKWWLFPDGGVIVVKVPTCLLCRVSVRTHVLVCVLVRSRAFVCVGVRFRFCFGCVRFRVRFSLVRLCAFFRRQGIAW